jgi:hypothetical protein
MVWRPPQPPPEPRRGGVKGGADGVNGDLLQLAGDSGGEHGAADRQQELDLRVGSLARADRSLVRQEWNQEPSQSPVQHLAAVPWLLAGAS